MDIDPENVKEIRQSQDVVPELSPVPIEDTGELERVAAQNPWLTDVVENTDDPIVVVETSSTLVGDRRRIAAGSAFAVLIGEEAVEVHAPVQNRRGKEHVEVYPLSPPPPRVKRRCTLGEIAITAVAHSAFRLTRQRRTGK